MNTEDTKEWFKIADNDYDSAILLNEAVRKHHEIICYHCAQAVEKYLKGYLIFNDVIPQKTHNLLFLNNLCNEIDAIFGAITYECGFLNRFVNDIRYPHNYETTEADVVFSIQAAEKIRQFGPLSELREIIMYTK
jgi:HEPN domain-containing protein